MHSFEKNGNRINGSNLLALAYAFCERCNLIIRLTGRHFKCLSRKRTTIETVMKISLEISELQRGNRLSLGYLSPFVNSKTVCGTRRLSKPLTPPIFSLESCLRIEVKIFSRGLSQFVEEGRPARVER